MLSLNDRIKTYYENRYRIYLTRRMPVVIRIDGKAFHTFTEKMKKPFDPKLSFVMDLTLLDLMKDIQGAKIGYTQSDEISIFITDYDKLETDAWFDYNLQKIVSVASSLATAHFNANAFNSGLCEFNCSIPILATFDARAFNIPKEEVTNYFLDRQLDCIKNSVSGLSQVHFSPNKLIGKHRSNLISMLSDKGISWEASHPRHKYGATIFQKDLPTIYNILVSENREKYDNIVNNIPEQEETQTKNKNEQLSQSK